MKVVPDFEDLLEALNRHKVRHLIIGGMAFIYHAKPRYTKDIDIWVDPAPRNIDRANRALSEFGSPAFLETGDPDQILQIGVAPNRVDLLLSAPGLSFALAWKGRIEGKYGRAPALWIGLDSLLAIKEAIPAPRHQEDARVLRDVKRLRARKARR
jgi:hypothetical protein